MFLYTLVLICFTVVVILCQSDSIDYYEYIIKQQINSSIYYRSPEDASEYEPDEPTNVQTFGSYDFIVVGAGASGSVLANRLSEESQWNVLLLEAGAFGNDVTDIPDMVESIRSSDYNWAYKTVPQETSCLEMINQQCPCPRGKGIGGTTLINGLMFVRGNRIDFDNWAREGNPGWSYDEVLPYFLKMENFNKTDPGAVVDEEYHGHGGNLNVEYPVPRHPLVSLWLDANEEKGYKIVDYNGRQQMGAAVAQMNTNHGRREDGGNAYIKSIRNRRNLKILTNSLVTKVAISRRSRRAYGVHFAHNGSFYLAKAKKEVILSAGAIGSAQILMLSGVGPARHLQEVGIEVIEDLEVGSRLQDHATFPKLYFNSDFSKTHKRLSTYIEEYLNGTGALAVPNHYAGLGFYQTRFATEPDYPDLEIMMIPSDGFSEILEEQLANAKGETQDQKKSFYMFIAGLHLRSSGTVRLKGNNPFDYPVIDARFLSDPDNVDIDTLYEGVQLALSLVDTKPFKEINTTVVRYDLPACNNKTFLSESYWHCVIRQFTGIVGHPVGTCRMGPEAKNGAVVNAKAEVHGIKKLRVVDASIFPFTFSGHPNAPCVMAGEKVSDLIKKDYL